MSNEQLAPNPRFPERVTNTVERKLADNTARRGRERVYEGTGDYFQGDAALGFDSARQGATDNREIAGNVYNTQIAAGRGRVGSGQPMEHWTHERARLGAFAQGTARPAGTSTSERPGTIYQKVYAPPNGGRGVRNDAEVSG
jgi:hypothetical protein